jgi:hypothetical protein
MSAAAATLALAGVLGVDVGLAHVPPRLPAARTAESPAIDGRLDDPAWRAATPSGAFTQEFPDEGRPPSETTEVRLLFDDDNLYVGVDCPQTSSPIVRRLQRRDGGLSSDRVTIEIDSRASRVGAFHFSVNADGTLVDGIYANDGGLSTEWDAVWEARAATTATGWSVEMRIPLSALRFEPGSTQPWGLEVKRYIDARQEIDDWAFVPRAAGTYVPLFGHIDGLEGIRASRRLELRPFVLSRVGYRAEPLGGTLARGAESDTDVGLDTKLQLSNEATLDLAVRPDFGQIEPDAVILNLSTYEAFFPEKRPLFLEGADVFAMLQPLLYTRRIGRAPGFPLLAPGESAMRAPGPSRIWGAAKVSGTWGGRTALGAIAAVTGANDVDVRDVAGGQRAVTADPWTAHTVLRVKRLVGDGAEIGAFASAVNRFEPKAAPGTPCSTSFAVAAADGRCSNDAYAGSVDGRLRSASGDYRLAWQAFGSLLANGPARAQPDGRPVEAGRPGWGGALYLGKEGGQHWLANVTASVSGRQLEVNDLGFLERKNDLQTTASLTRRTLGPWWRTVETRTALVAGARATLDGLVLGRYARLSTDLTFRSFWAIAAELRGNGSVFDDREFGDGSALERPASWGAGVQVASDRRRKLSGYVMLGVDRHAYGPVLSASGELTARPLSRLQIDLAPAFSFDAGTPRFVGISLADPSAGPLAYQLARQQATSLGATLRTAFTFTPALSLQAYGQLFLWRIRYGPFYTVAHQSGARERIELAALGPSTATAPGGLPDLNAQAAAFNASVVLRWEFRLGSTLFLVYTRAQAPAPLSPASAAVSEGLRALWRGQSANDVVMAKLTYWWG